MMKIHNATILVTDRCNSRCITCNIWKEKRKRTELSPEEYYNLFSRKEFSSLDNINVSGGEATLRDDLTEVVKAILYGKKLKVFFLSTNGTNPQKAYECLQAVKGVAEQTFLSVSIDGDRKTHRSIRGIDNYDSALETISLCKKQDPSIITNISLTLSVINTNSMILSHLKRIADETDSTLSYRFAFNSSEYFHNDEKQFGISSDMKELVRSFIKDNSWDDPFMRIQYKYLEDGTIDIMKKDGVVCCGAGKKFVLVSPNGDIYPCINSNHLIGDYDRGIFDYEYEVGAIEPCPCCMELCVWPNFSE